MRKRRQFIVIYRKPSLWIPPSEEGDTWEYKVRKISKEENNIIKKKSVTMSMKFVECRDNPLQILLKNEKALLLRLRAKHRRGSDAASMVRRAIITIQSYRRSLEVTYTHILAQGCGVTVIFVLELTWLAASGYLSQQLLVSCVLAYSMG